MHVSKIMIRNGKGKEEMEKEKEKETKKYSKTTPPGGCSLAMLLLFILAIHSEQHVLLGWCRLTFLFRLGLRKYIYHTYDGIKQEHARVSIIVVAPDS